MLEQTENIGVESETVVTTADFVRNDSSVCAKLLDERVGVTAYAPRCNGATCPTNRLSSVRSMFNVRVETGDRPGNLPRQDITSIPSTPSPRLKNGGADMARHTNRFDEARRFVAGVDLTRHADHYVCGPRKDDGSHDVERFGTTTGELQCMAAWMKERKVESVAMESTGVYWIPVHDTLESSGTEVVLVDTRTVKMVPGRKSDVKDCQWRQRLYSCGLMRGAFRPPEVFNAGRSVIREKVNVLQMRTQAILSIQKSLDQMNIRLHHAVSGIDWVTGMRMLAAIAGGERVPRVLAALRDKWCKKAEAEIVEELTGTWRDEHLFSLTNAYEASYFLDGQVSNYDVKIRAMYAKIAEAFPSIDPPPQGGCRRPKDKISYRQDKGGNMNTLTAFASTATLVWSALASNVTWTVQPNTTSDLDVRNEGRCLYAYTSNADQVRVNGVEFARYTAGVSAFATDATLTAVEASGEFSRHVNFWGSAPWSGSESYKGLLKCGWYNTPARNVTLTLKGLSVGKRYLVQIWMCDVRGLGQRTNQKLTIGGVTGNKEGNGYGSNWVGTFTAAAETEVVALTYNDEALISAFQVRGLDEAKVDWQAFTTFGEGDVRTAGTLHCACKAGKSSTVNGVTFSSTPNGTVDFGDRLSFSMGLGSAHTAFCQISDTVPAGAYSYSANYQVFVACGFWQTYVDDRCIRRNMTVKGLTPGLKYLVQLWAFDNRSADSKNRSVLYDDGVMITHGDGTRYGHGSYVVGTFTAVSTEQTISCCHTKGYGMAFGEDQEMVGPIQVRCLDTQPGVIDWSAGATAVDGSVDVRGRSLYAYCCNATTVSGTDFAQLRSIADYQGDISVSAALTCAPSPFVTDVGKTGMSDSVIKLLQGAFWHSKDTDPTLTLTLHNLKPGHRHLVQIWACDQRSNGDNGQYMVDGTVTVAYNAVPDSGNVRGRWAKGTFIAGSPDQTIVLSNCTPEWKINAIQVRVLDESAVDWSSGATDVNGSVDVHGQSLYAYCCNATTVSRTSFAEARDIADCQGDISVSASLSCASSPFITETGLSDAVARLLKGGFWVEATKYQTITLTLHNLKPWHRHLVQIWACDQRTNGNNGQYVVDGAVTVAYNAVPNPDNPRGRWATGSFVAGSHDQTIVLSNCMPDWGTWNLNAIQVRDLGWDGTVSVWTEGDSGSWSTAGDGWGMDGVSLAGQTVWDADHGLTQVAGIPDGTTLALAEDVFARGIVSEGEIVLGVEGKDKTVALDGSIVAPKATINFPWKSTLISSTAYGEKNFVGSIAAVKYIVVGDGTVMLASAPAEGVAAGVYAPGTLKVPKGVTVVASSVAGDGVYAGPGRIDLASGNAVSAPSAKPSDGLVWGLLNGTILQYPGGFDFSTTAVYLEDPAAVSAAGTVVLAVDGVPIGKPNLLCPDAASGSRWRLKWVPEKSGFAVIPKQCLSIVVRQVAMGCAMFRVASVVEVLLSCASALAEGRVTCCPTALSPLVDLVDPMIGTVTYPESGLRGDECIHGFGKTFPGAVTPFGAVQLSPDTVTGGDNGSGYSYTHGTIEGFSFFHMSGIGYYGDFGNFQVMPGGVDQSRFSHAEERADAGYYRVRLPDVGVVAELTAAKSSGMIRFTYEKGGEGEFRIDLARRIGELTRAKPHGRQIFRLRGDHSFEGEIVCDHRDGGWGRGASKVDYAVRFRGICSKPLDRATRTGGETNLVVTAKFPVAAGERVVLHVAFGFVGEPEMPRGFDFEAMRSAAKSDWSAAFSLVDVEGGTEKERRIFAIALYHAMLDPRAVGEGNGFTKRTIFSGWDVYRSEMPLLTLIRPDIVSDTTNSLMETVESGRRQTLPRWDIFGCPSGCMVGQPLVPVMAMAYERGIRSFDANKALRLAMRSLEVESNDRMLGYTPGSISETLEYAYADWCCGRLAEMLNEKEISARYYGYAKAYTNCWSKEVGLMRARTADGGWLKWEGREKSGQGCVESNPWQQGWFVPHDPDGLIRLMGGRRAFTAELDRFFSVVPDDFRWNDAYNHPNEVCHMLPFPWALSDDPGRVGEWTHRICTAAYGEGPFGLCGNEDVGQMSAWYVLSAIGMHPLCPGDGKWYLTAPLFRETRMWVGKSVFRILTRNAGEGRRRFLGARLNGRPLDRNWVSTSEIIGGGTLEID